MCQQPGVRLAEPGEFTRRAVEAGKYDLVEAEAVADLIEADSTEQRKQALRQLNGVTSARLDAWRDALLETLALIEVTVDFPDEEDAPDYTSAPVKSRLVSLHADLVRALDDGGIGEQVRDGFRIALVGRPNAGKSSLLNRLAGRDAAIVTDIPGTTRDIVEVRMTLGGYLVILSDTAGLRETSDPVEKEGVRRARDAATDANLVLVVTDEDDATVLTLDPGPTRLIVRNKSDLLPRNVSRETLHVSAKTGDGIDRLLSEISSEIERLASRSPNPVITRRRHRTAISSATASISSALSGLDAGHGMELVAEDVRQSVHALSSLVGSFGVEDVLGEIFSSFCIGK